MINTAAYSFVSQAYPDQITGFVSLIESVAGIGCTISPIIGVYIFNVVGFSETFYIFGGAMAPCALLMLSLPDPKELSKQEKDDYDDNRKMGSLDNPNEPKNMHDKFIDDLCDEDQEKLLKSNDQSKQSIGDQIELEQLTYGKLICNQRVLHSAITAAIMYLVYGTLEPILALRLPDYTDLTKEETGFIFGIEPLTYLTGSMLVPFLIPQWVAHRVTLITSLLILSFATFLVGPVFADKNLNSMIIGLALSGFIMAFLGIPNMPEMIEACEQEEKDNNNNNLRGVQRQNSKVDKNHANSMISGLLNASFGIGQTLGPLCGAFWFQ